ncbi:hypothetical protein Bca52824_072749 [Brassica carinata]|uniref:STM1-like N-terminal domain-containing protein n=1 Tax=Brassica carinata TaxID=52824 RepID=A0A8X7Q8P0_BRACI|nr:hypothetical protein Bca52824_072749 [Brassica carinata]
MATLNPFDMLDDGAKDPSQIAISIAADKPKKPAPVSAVSAKSSAPSRQLAQPVREARSDAPRGGGRGGGDGGFSCGRGGYNRDFRGGDGNSKPSEEACVSKPLNEKRSVYGGARRGGGRRGEAGDGVTSKAKKLVVEIGEHQEKELLLCRLKKLLVLRLRSPLVMRLLLMLTRRTTLKWRSEKESEEKGSDKDKRKDDKEEKAKKAVNINEFLKPGEGENYYRGGGRGGRGRGRGGRDGEGASGGGFDGYHSEAAPAIGDTAQFPSLGGK